MICESTLCESTLCESTLCESTLCESTLCESKLTESDAPNLVPFKNRGELGNFQQVAHARLRVCQFKFALCLAGSQVNAHQRAQAGAVNILNARKVKHNALVAGNNSTDCGLELIG